MSKPEGGTPVAVRLFRRLARLLLPESFRRSHIVGLTSVFADLFRASVARGRPDETALLFAREILGLVRLAWMEWSAVRADCLVTDLRHALRSLVRRPALTMVMVGTLAVGIGPTTAVFSLVRGVVIDPLPFPGGDRLVQLWRSGEGPESVMDLTPTVAMVEAWQARSRSFDGLAALSESEATVTGDGPPENLQLAEVSPGLVAWLGVRPLVGRLFVAEDGEAGGNDHVVLLSEDLWRRRFGADPKIAGSTLTLSGERYEVIGVLPRDVDTWFETGFFGIGPKEAWVPLQAEATGAWAVEPYIIGRLSKGVSSNAALTELFGIQSELTAAGLIEAEWSPVVTPPARALDSKLRTGLWVAFGAVLIVLLIACVNVGNLLVVRGMGRVQEIRIRSALGAGRGRLIRQILTESLLVSLIGGAAGVVLAAGTLNVVVAGASESLPALRSARIDWTVLGFAFTLTLVTGSVFGLLPSRGLGSPDPPGAMLSGGMRATSAGPRSTRARETMVALQVSFALILLSGAGLLVKSFGRLAAVDPGFDAQGLLSVGVELPEDEYPDGEARSIFASEVVEAVKVLPGVAGATWARAVPPVLPALFGEIEAAGQGEPTSGPNVHVGNWVDSNYFEVLGSDIVEGRQFSPNDGIDGSVVIINRAMAERVWPGRSAVGQRIRVMSPLWAGGTQPWRTVVGVTQDVKAFWLGDDPFRFQMYMPGVERIRSYGTLIVRSTDDAKALIPSLRDRIWSMAPSIPLDEVQIVEDKLAETLSRPRLEAALLSSFSFIGLFLALLGVYGTLMLAVSLRTREIGVRVALGARTHEVVRLVLGGSMRSVTAGIVLGLAVSLGIARFFESLLFDVGTVDPPTYLAVLSLLVLATLGASVVPARRAARIDPVDALRAE